jgi:hypothetical protein
LDADATADDALLGRAELLGTAGLLVGGALLGSGDAASGTEAPADVEALAGLAVATSGAEDVQPVSRASRALDSRSTGRVRISAC